MTTHLLENVVIAFLAIFVGIKLIRDGWLMWRQQKIILYFPAKLVLYIIRLTQGPEAASIRRAAITEPEKVRLSGIYGMCGGFLSLLAGAILLIDSVMKLLGFSIM